MLTFFIAILLIIGIVIIFDISEKIDDFVAKQLSMIRFHLIRCRLWRSLSDGR